jgi:type II secretory pathway component PulF
MGYQPTLVQIAQRTLTAAEPVQPAPAAAPPVSHLAAKDRDVARTLHQLHLAFRAGMAPILSLTTVAGQSYSPAVRQALMEMSQVVQAGGTLSQAMARFPRLFEPGDVGMVRAAELGGFLPEALEALSLRREEDDNARGRLRLWVWFFHLNLVTLFFFLPVGSILKDVFPSFDVRVGLAAAIRSLLFLSLPLTAGYLGLVLWLGRYRASPASRRKWHRFLLGVPLAGRLAHVRARSAFTRSLAWLFHAGVNPPTAWETACGSVPNLALAERFREALPVVQSTGRPSAAFQVTGMFDPSDAGMVATGEATGEIPQALNYLANRYEEEARVVVQESVSKATGLFRVWALLLGALGFALVMWFYGQGVLKIGTEGEGF